MISRFLGNLIVGLATLLPVTAFAGFFVEEAPSVQSHDSPFAKPSVELADKAAPQGPVALPAPKAECEFAIIAGDDTLETAVKRWAASSGWQAPQWNYRTVYVDYKSTFCGDGGFEGAVDRLMTAENAAGIPLFATFYSNNVVVIDGGK